MNILVTGVQIPFARGGAELLIERLLAELRARGHAADLVQLPFTALPKERILDSIVQFRSLELAAFGGNPIDLVIGTKFPSYCVRHPRKAVWLIHQHRQAYELYGNNFGDFTAEPEDEALRQMIVSADETSLREATGIFTISNTVSKRLTDFFGIPSRALLPPPPLDGRYRHGTRGEYVLSVGRLCSIKRPDLLIQALPHIPEPLRLKIVGVADQPGYQNHLAEEARKHRVLQRIDFLGRVSDEELIELYANAFCVYYAPHDEDYGFVTLEAFASGKPVITATDSGGVLQFVEHERNGLIVSPNGPAIAGAISALRSEQLYERLVTETTSSARTTPWEEIIAALTGPVRTSGGSL